MRFSDRRQQVNRHGGAPLTRWHETEKVLRAIHELPSDASAVLATIVGLDGSGYRRPGAKMLVLSDGSSIGGLSGGCLEADVRLRGVALIESQSGPELLTYETREEENEPHLGIGLGCDGTVQILIQVIDGEVRRRMSHAAECMRRGIPLVIGFFWTGEDTAGFLWRPAVEGEVLDDRRMSDSIDSLNSATGAAHIALDAVAGDAPESASPVGSGAFLEYLIPPPLVLICGGDDDSIPLARALLNIGFRVEVADHRPAVLEKTRFPAGTRLRRISPSTPRIPEGMGSRDFAVVKTHSKLHDAEWLEALSSSEVRYIGVLGTRRRTDALLRTTDRMDERIYSPAGVDIGAEGPEQIAISISAEILEIYSNHAAALSRRELTRVSELVRGPFTAVRQCYG